MNFSDKLKQFIERIGKRNFIILTSLFFIIIIVVIIIVVTINTSNQAKRINTTANSHTYLIEYTIGETLSSQIISDLESVVLDENEIKTAPSKNTAPQNIDRYYFYNIVFDENSLKTISTRPDKIYKLTANISDNRIYELTYRIDENYGNNYLVVAINRIDEKAGNDFAFIHTNNTNEYKDLLTNYINKLNLNSPNIKIVDLKVSKGNYE